jgi:hypothetical protein
VCRVHVSDTQTGRHRDQRPQISTMSVSLELPYEAYGSVSVVSGSRGWIAVRIGRRAGWLAWEDRACRRSYPRRAEGTQPPLRPGRTTPGPVEPRSPRTPSASHYTLTRNDAEQCPPKPESRASRRSSPRLRPPDGMGAASASSPDSAPPQLPGLGRCHVDPGAPAACVTMSRCHLMCRAVEAASLAAWCTDHRGSAPAAELFRSGHLSAVIGLRLADKREVVVKVRPASPRIAACAEVQRRMFGSGYPCPEPLGGPALLGDGVATAEAYVPGGDVLPGAEHAAQLSAEAFAWLIGLVLQPDFVIFMADGLVAGSGRSWPGAGAAAGRSTIAAGAGCRAPCR